MATRSKKRTDETVDLETLVPDAANVRTRDGRAGGVLASSLKQFGAARSIVVDKDNVVLAGNGTLEAAAAAGITKVRVIEADGSELIAVRRSNLSETARVAYSIADNRTAELAEWDEAGLDSMLQSLHAAEVDLEELGFSEDELHGLFDEDGGGDDGEGEYSGKVESPVYEPTGERPRVGDLFDLSRVAALTEQIRKADLPAEVSGFLVAAASRHTVFHYDKIAEFYAHAEPEVQALFEESALVLIDFEKAIELGFVRMSAEIAAARTEDETDE